MWYCLFVAGNYWIDICYFGEPVKDAPFTARAWDPAGVMVYNIKPGIVCEESFFNSQSTLLGVTIMRVSNCYVML